MAVAAGVGLAARVAGRSKVVRDAAGRFSTAGALKAAGQVGVQGGVMGAVQLKFNKPHGHAACGKGQYKSAECRARAIAKNKGGDLSPRQATHLKNFFGNKL